MEFSVEGALISVNDNIITIKLTQDNKETMAQYTEKKKKIEDLEKEIKEMKQVLHKHFVNHSKYDIEHD